MKILLTGSNGQVGFELERSLQNVGEVIALDRRRLDLSDIGRVKEIVREIRPHVIVNAAAYTAVDNAEKDDAAAMRINAEAPGVMAEEARRLGAALVHYSTDYVFDGRGRKPFAEADPTAPLNAYGRSKLAGEMAVLQAAGPHLILRTSWVYGTRGKNFLGTMQRLARERDELRVVNDQFGAPTWSRSIAAATSQLLAQAAQSGNPLEVMSEKSGIYHLVCGGETSWHGFAQAILERMSSGMKPRLVPISTSEFPTPARRPEYSVLATDKLHSAFRLCLPHWETALDFCVSTRQSMELS